MHVYTHTRTHTHTHVYYMYIYASSGRRYRALLTDARSLFAEEERRNAKVCFFWQTL